MNNLKKMKLHQYLDSSDPYWKGRGGNRVSGPEKPSVKEVKEEIPKRVLSKRKRVDTITID